jgi:hypothetical protein
MKPSGDMANPLASPTLAGLSATHADLVFASATVALAKSRARVRRMIVSATSRMDSADLISGVPALDA